MRNGRKKAVWENKRRYGRYIRGGMVYLYKRHGMPVLEKAWYAYKRGMVCPYKEVYTSATEQVASSCTVGVRHALAFYTTHMVTIQYIWLTIIYIWVTIIFIWVTIQYIWVTILYIWVTIYQTNAVVTITFIL